LLKADLPANPVLARQSGQFHMGRQRQGKRDIIQGLTGREGQPYRSVHGLRHRASTLLLRCRLTGQLRHRVRLRHSTPQHQPEYQGGSYRTTPGQVNLAALTGTGCRSQHPAFEIRRSGRYRIATGQLVLQDHFDLCLPGSGLAVLHKLKPVLRLVDNAQVGTITGAVSAELITEAFGGVATTDGFLGNIYVHTGADQTPDDIGSANEPLVVVPVEYGEEYSYQASFIPEGDYTVSYTCDSDLIEDTEGNPSDDELNFTNGQNATVTAGETTTVNF
jgi:hypothetical protein